MTVELDVKILRVNPWVKFISLFELLAQSFICKVVSSKEIATLSSYRGLFIKKFAETVQMLSKYVRMSLYVARYKNWYV